MRKLKRFFDTLFGISSGEFSGFTWLIVTALVCVISLVVVDNVTKQPYNNYEKDAALLDSLLASMETGKQETTVSTNVFQLHLFNPNEANQDELVELGFPAWLARQLVNFRSKGGEFRKPEDLLKLYNFPDSLFQKLKPYVDIPITGNEKIHSSQASDPPKKKFEDKAPATVQFFDLNMADTAVLQSVKGIGSVLSKRIVSYRTKLGGFVQPDQLYEVYKLDSGVVKDLVKTSFIADTFEPRQILINSIEEKELASHPYVSWQQARLIVAYRKQHGNFNNKEALLSVYSINEEWLIKIGPYLSF